MRKFFSNNASFWRKMSFPNMIYKAQHWDFPRTPVETLLIGVDLLIICSWISLQPTSSVYFFLLSRTRFFFWLRQYLSAHSGSQVVGRRFLGAPGWFVLVSSLFTGLLILRVLLLIFPSKESIGWRPHRQSHSLPPKLHLTSANPDDLMSGDRGHPLSSSYSVLESCHHLRFKVVPSSGLSPSSGGSTTRASSSTVPGSMILGV